jgi:hypothetical protein
VWDPVVGCPNYCNGEEELERRREAEQARAVAEAMEKVALEEAEKERREEERKAVMRSESSPELMELRARQMAERERFEAFRAKERREMWHRQANTKLALLAHHSDMVAKTRERHAKTAEHLEDRQVVAEMELRTTLKQRERSVHIRLRHMEDYFSGKGANGRVVSERDKRELGQQYLLRDGIERLHQGRINVLREKQSRQMEGLVEMHKDALQHLADKQAHELDLQEEGFVREEETLVGLFNARKGRLRRRWVLIEEITRTKLEVRDGMRYAQLPELEWPDGARKGSVLEAVDESPTPSSSASLVVE